MSTSELIERLREDAAHFEALADRWTCELPEGSTYESNLRQRAALFTRAGDALAERDARIAELEAGLNYVVGLLPGLAGASNQPDNAVYSVLATKGEILKARTFQTAAPSEVASPQGRASGQAPGAPQPTHPGTGR